MIMNCIFNIPFRKLYAHKRKFDYAEASEGHRNNLSFKRECKKRAHKRLRKQLKIEENTSKDY